MKIDKGCYMEEYAADSREQSSLRRVLTRDSENGTVRNMSFYSFKAITTRLFDES